MNKNFILFNLVEAKEELDRTIKELKSDSEYEEPELSVAMMHLFHHVSPHGMRDTRPLRNRRIVPMKTSIDGIVTLPTSTKWQLNDPGVTAAEQSLAADGAIA